jgi:hypothetical protein
VQTERDALTGAFVAATLLCPGMLSVAVAPAPFGSGLWIAQSVVDNRVLAADLLAGRPGDDGQGTQRPSGLPRL